MTNKNSSKMEVPQAKEAMNRFKMEVANEIGVNLKDGYNGDLTSREAGSIGGEMVRQMIKKQEESMKLSQPKCEIKEDSRFADKNCLAAVSLF